MSQIMQRSRIARTIAELAVHAKGSEPSISIISRDHAGDEGDFAIRLAETIGYWAVIARIDPMSELVRDPAALRDDLAEQASRSSNPLIFIVDATRHDAEDSACQRALDVVATQMQGEWSISGRASLYLIAADPIAVARRIGDTLGRQDWTGFIRY
jgi:hypothetical protein